MLQVKVLDEIKINEAGKMKEVSDSGISFDLEILAN